MPLNQLPRIDRKEASSSKTPELAVEIDKMERSTIILSPGDFVITKVTKKLVYEKSLANKLYTKKKMFSLRMGEGSSLNEHNNEFNKVCDALKIIIKGLSDENNTLLLISFLLKSYDHFLDALL